MMHILHSKRTIISPLAVTDIDEIINMYHEPDSNKFIPILLNKTDAEYRDFLRTKIQTNDHPKGLGVWTVRAADSQEYIGTVNLNVMPILDIVHIGAHLSRSVWGKGYATETLAALLDYGLNTLKLPVIHGICSVDHVVSKKMLLRTGLVYDRTVDFRGEDVEIYLVHRK